MAVDNPFGTPPVFPPPLIEPTVTHAMTPTAGTETVKTPEPSTVLIKKVDRYEEGNSPLLYVQDVLREYGQESDIPVGHDYWDIKRRIK